MRLAIVNIDQVSEYYTPSKLNDLTDARHWIINHLDLSKHWVILKL